MRSDLPSGTVTFLFTDVEGSTRLLHELGAQAYAEALAEHRRVIREACVVHGGAEVDTQGDAFFFAFPTAPGALAAAQSMVHELERGAVRVRVGLHTGTPLLTGEGYVGPDTHRAARIAAAGHGGQILVSASTASLVDRDELRELGEHRLKDLSAAERIFQLGDAEFPALKALHQSNMPVPSTPFLGREKELWDVGGLLARSDVRLLTLTGPGGTGKTRLAAQAAGWAADDYPDGVWWVPLDALSDPSLVLERASQALGAKRDLREHIGERRMLVLLDCFDRVVEGGGVLAELLVACPRLNLLVTSRERLHVTAEQEYAVPPFAHEEAVGFFAARARAVKHDFEVDDAVSELCRRLDDMPLALELAAAHASAFSTRQLLAQGLSLRTEGPRDLPDRQRSLWGTIDWSYDVLAEDEQRLFRRLAVFAGGCTLETAEKVAGADLETLESLLNKSLIRRQGERYRMLDTIREYALERLEASGDGEAFRDRHAAHFFALAETERLAEGSRKGPIAGLRSELDNFRAATAWLRAGADRELELKLALSLYELWIVGGYAAEGEKTVLRALERNADSARDLRALALKAAGDLALDYGNYSAANERLEQALDIYRDLGDRARIARCLTDLGHVAKCLRDESRAEALFEESVALARDLDDSDVLAEALLNHGDFLLSTGDFVRAEAICRESLSLYRTLRYPLGSASCQFSLALAALHQARYREALTLLQQALRVFRDHEYAVGVASTFEGLAALATVADRREDAARLIGAAGSLFERAGVTLEPTELAMHERTIDAIRADLGEGRLAELVAEGRAMSLENAVEQALQPLDLSVV